MLDDHIGDILRANIAVLGAEGTAGSRLESCSSRFVTHPRPKALIMMLLGTAAAAIVGAALFERLHVPAGALLGAMLGVGVLNVAMAAGAHALPSSARFFAYAALGWLIGQGITRETFQAVARSALPVTLVVLALLSFGALLGWLLVHADVLDPATAYLATSPGALSQMAAVGASVGADASLVVAVHTLRVVALAIAAPFIGRLAGAT